MTKKEEIIRAREQNPDWTQQRIAEEVGCSIGHVSNTLQEWQADKEEEMRKDNENRQSSLPEDKETSSAEEDSRDSDGDITFTNEELVNLNHGLPAGYWFHVIKALLEKNRRESSDINVEISKRIIQQVMFEEEAGQLSEINDGSASMIEALAGQ